MAYVSQKLARFQPATVSAVILAAAVFVFMGGLFPFADQVELKTIDLRFRLRGEMPPNPAIVLATVDEKSIDREGKWPWPRSRIASLVQTLSDAGAGVIGFDIGFLEPDAGRVSAAIEEVRKKTRDLGMQDPVFLSFLEDLEHRSDNDRALSEAVARSKAKIVLGFFFHLDKNSPENNLAADADVLSENIKGARYSFIRYSSQKAREIFLVEASAPEPNISKIAGATPHAGFFNMIPDSDGVVRSITPLIKFKDEFYAPLSVVTAAVFLDDAPSVFLDEHGVDKYVIGDISIPADENGGIMIDYRGPQQSFPHISVTDILSGEISGDVFKNKIVLVGVTAAAVYDLRVTPFGGVFPGLEIHANAIDNILAERALYKPRWLRIADISLILFPGVFLSILLQRKDAVFAGAAASFLFLGHIGLCTLFFARFRVVLNMTYPLASIALIYAGVVSYRYLAESRQKRFVKDAFSTYVSAEVVQQLLESPEKIVLGGEEREITAFFSDVQGFTSISEKLEPPELVDLLNEFLTEMADIIMKHKGMVDKFEGDAIIAMFGAPTSMPNHAEAACLAAVEMQKRLETLRRIWKSSGKPPLKMRIGLYSGNAVVGNMGSRSRMDYTMMGDTVNTAARLEGVNKIYGVYTLMGESTCKAAGDWVAVREIDMIKVVGKNEAVRIFELMGHPEDVDDILRETVRNYTRGLYAYRAGDWNRAIIFFNKALAQTPDDGPSLTMLKRCNHLKINPPGKNWDGSFAMKSK